MFEFCFRFKFLTHCFNLTLLIKLKMVAETVVFYTLVFLFYSFLEISGSMPQEIQSSGLTLTKLLSRHYGDEVIRRVYMYKDH